jgi:hypothetical protein
VKDGDTIGRQVEGKKWKEQKRNARGEKKGMESGNEKEINVRDEERKI